MTTSMHLSPIKDKVLDRLRDNPGIRFERARGEMEQLAIETPLYGRMGTCEEAADSIFLLALPEAGLITGSNIHASGGFSIF